MGSSQVVKAQSEARAALMSKLVCKATGVVFGLYLQLEVAAGVLGQCPNATAA